MKNNKKSPGTIARQAAFKASEPGLAVLMTQTPQNAFAGELAAIGALSAELVGVDTPEMKQSRIAMEATAQGYRENTPELYGRKTVEVDFGTGYRVHTNGASADCELDETSQALIATVSHAGTSGEPEEKPEPLDL